MSYGYLIGSKNPIPELPKSRRFKFTVIGPSENLFLYSRLEESNELTHRLGDMSSLTPAGRAFFSALPMPVFFMDFMLANRQGELELAAVFLSKMRGGAFKVVSPATLDRLSLNTLYKFEQ